MKPETEDECSSRKLKELEGKNIAHYSILLETIIKTELEAVKQIITVASAAIGLVFTISSFPNTFTKINLANWMVSLILSGSILCFALSICLGINFISKASKKYEADLRDYGAVEISATLERARESYPRAKSKCVWTFSVGIFLLTIASIICIAKRL